MRKNDLNYIHTPKCMGNAKIISKDNMRRAVLKCKKCGEEFTKDSSSDSDALFFNR